MPNRWTFPMFSNKYTAKATNTQRFFFWMAKIFKMCKMNAWGTKTPKNLSSSKLHEKWNQFVMQIFSLGQEQVTKFMVITRIPPPPLESRLSRNSNSKQAQVLGYSYKKVKKERKVIIQCSFPNYRVLVRWAIYKPDLAVIGCSLDSNIHFHVKQPKPLLHTAHWPYVVGSWSVQQTELGWPRSNHRFILLGLAQLLL